MEGTIGVLYLSDFELIQIMHLNATRQIKQICILLFIWNNLFHTPKRSLIFLAGRVRTGRCTSLMIAPLLLLNIIRFYYLPSIFLNHEGWKWAFFLSKILDFSGCRILNFYREPVSGWNKYITLTEWHILHGFEWVWHCSLQVHRVTMECYAFLLRNKLHWVQWEIQVSMQGFQRKIYWTPCQI